MTCAYFKIYKRFVVKSGEVATHIVGKGELHIQNICIKSVKKNIFFAKFYILMCRIPNLYLQNIYRYLFLAMCTFLIWQSYIRTILNTESYTRSSKPLLLRLFNIGNL